MEENATNYEFVKVTDILQQIDAQNDLTEYNPYYSNAITEY